MQGKSQMGIMINALEYARRLKEAGIDSKAAEAQALALADVLNDAVETRLATKVDLTAVETKLTADIERVETKLTANIQGVEAKLTADIQGVEAKLTADIQGVEVKLTANINAVENRLDHKIDQLELRLNNKMYMMTFSIVTLLGGLMTIFHFH